MTVARASSLVLAGCPSDTTHCPMVTSKSVWRMTKPDSGSGPLKRNSPTDPALHGLAPLVCEFISFHWESEICRVCHISRLLLVLDEFWMWPSSGTAGVSIRCLLLRHRLLRTITIWFISIFWKCWSTHRLRNVTYLSLKRWYHVVHRMILEDGQRVKSTSCKYSIKRLLTLTVFNF